MEAEASLFGHSASMRIVPDCTGEGGPCQLLLMLLLPTRAQLNRHSAATHGTSATGRGEFSYSIRMANGMRKQPKERMSTNGITA
eukprot:scaffold73083_cov48-Phaeocystis_antarctica.AAC.1